MQGGYDLYMLLAPTHQSLVSVSIHAGSLLLCRAAATNGGRRVKHALGIMRPHQAVNTSSSTPESLGLVRLLHEQPKYDHFRGRF
jgi:hypothetical protein